MQKTYRIHVGGKIFENSNTRVLAKRAVEATRACHEECCRRCGRRIEERDLTGYRFCFSCIEEAVTLLLAARPGRTQATGC